MAQSAKVLAAKSKDLSSCPGTPVGGRGELVPTGCDFYMCAMACMPLLPKERINVKN